jgi:hypothetical protein
MSAKEGAKGSKNSSSIQIPQWLEDASQSAVGRADTLSRRSYTGYNGQRVAGLGRNEQMAASQANAFGARTNNKIRTGFQGSDLDQFANPYLDRVLAQRKRGIGEEFGRQSASLEANQAAANAFRSGRSDLARSRLNESRLRALDEAEGTERSNAFDKSMGAYFQNEASLGGAFNQSQAALSQTGLAERGVRQARADFDYGQFLEQRDWDVNNMGPLLNAISTARGGSTTTNTSGGQGKDYWGAAAGVLSTAISTYMTPSSSSSGGTGGTGAGGGTPPANQYNAFSNPRGSLNA